VPPSSWTAADLADQQGRRIVITGGNSGIGLAAARVLARAGALVIIAFGTRPRDSGRPARSGTIPRSARWTWPTLNSVRAFAAETIGPIDVLINNAGVMAPPLSRTVQGFETQFGVNHLGHFALTNLLLPIITDRVVSVSSGAHRRGHIDLSDLNWERRRYQRWPAYGQSKLANLHFILELQRRLTAAGSPVRALGAHPGYAATNLQSHSGSPIMDGMMRLTNRIVAQSQEMGALPTLYAAGEGLPGGSYVGPNGRSELRGNPTLVGRSPEASDTKLAAALWTASEELTGVHSPL
jgi:NAD(P)-dependent dehydrogenase (short-subunit alcohol dehydrogenase family)